MRDGRPLKAQIWRRARSPGPFAPLHTNRPRRFPPPSGRPHAATSVVAVCVLLVVSPAVRRPPPPRRLGRAGTPADFFFSGNLSVISASVVRSRLATATAAFCNAPASARPWSDTMMPGLEHVRPSAPCRRIAKPVVLPSSFLHALAPTLTEPSSPAVSAQRAERRAPGRRSDVSSRRCVKVARSALVAGPSGVERLLPGELCGTAPTE
jgi:hypothetical protein